jgi:acetoacetyl-CoA synthetase
MEIPVRRLLMGEPIEKVASKDAMKNPAALEWFAAFARERRTQSGLNLRKTGSMNERFQ